MSKKIFTAVCILSLMMVLLTGCDTEEIIAPAENSYSQTRYSFTTHEQSPDIIIDGVLDDALWQGKHWFQNTYLANSAGNMPKIELTGFPTEYGVYIASVAYDQNLTSDGERAPSVNTNWELYLCACDVGEDLFSSKYDGEWSMKRIYIDLISAANSYFTNIDRAVVVEGELNSGATTKATMELFIPWEELGVDPSKGIPESFGVLPCYRGVLSVGGNTSWMAPVDSSINRTTAAYLFDANGYVNADREGCILGDGYYGYAKSKGWDLSRLEEGIVESPRGGHDKIFFSGEFGENFLVETTIIPVSAINDAYPKAGITFIKPDGLYYTIFADAKGANGLVDSINGTKNFPDYQLVTLHSNGGWKQAYLTGYDFTNPNATKQEGVRLTIVKYGTSFWYFADGRFLKNEEVVFMDGDCMPGFYSLGMHAIYKDYSCREISFEELTEYLNKNGMCTVEANVDSAGGTVSVNKSSLRTGESYTLSINTKSGYRLSSLRINDAEIIDKLRSGAKGGSYTVFNVTENQHVVASFEKCNELTYTCSFTNGEKGIATSVILEGMTDGSLYYSTDISANKKYEFKLPAGSYKMTVVATGHKGLNRVIELTEDTVEELVIEQSSFLDSVKVNGKTVSSDKKYYDLSQEFQGKVYGSRKLGTRGANLFMDGTGSDFLAHVTAKYVTDFQPGGDYQPDVFAGFTFHNGTDYFCIWARTTGIVNTSGGWKYIMDLFPTEVLTYPDARSVNLSVAKLGEDFYVFYDGKEVFRTAWSEITSLIPANSEMAVALTMWQDKDCDVEFSNYSVIFDREAIKQYVDTH